MAGTDDRQIIHMVGHVGEPVGDPEPALAMLFPRTFGAQNRGAILTHGQHRLLEAWGQRLPIQFIEQRLVIECIQVTWTTFHEQEDDALCLAEPMRQLGRHGVQGVGGASSESVFPQKSGQGHSSKAATRGAKEVTAVGSVGDVVASHNQRC